MVREARIRWKTGRKGGGKGEKEGKHKRDEGGRGGGGDEIEKLRRR